LRARATAAARARLVRLAAARALALELEEVFVAVDFFELVDWAETVSGSAQTSSIASPRTSHFEEERRSSCNTCLQPEKPSNSSRYRQPAYAMAERCRIVTSELLVPQWLTDINVRATNSVLASGSEVAPRHDLGYQCIGPRPHRMSQIPAPLASDALAAEEYRALRATIRERGTTRTIVLAITFFAWALVASLVFGGASSRPAILLPALLLLAAGFESAFALHVGVERIGRYLQVHYEAAATLPAWERTAMRLGEEPAAATGIDPLAAPLFLIATILNGAPLAFSGPAAWTPRPVESAVVVALHLGLLVHVARRRRFAAVQRARDLDTLQRIGI
jgi:hypothetical protein